MRASAAKRRPRYLSLPALLLEIRLPATAWTSLLHRISGVVLAASAGWLLHLLALGLASQDGFIQARTAIAHPASKMALVILIWAYCHHLLAGVRLLLLDVGIGVEPRRARLSSVLVIACGVGVAAMVAWRLWP